MNAFAKITADDISRTFIYREHEVTLRESAETGGWSYSIPVSRGEPLTGHEYGAWDIAEAAAVARLDLLAQGFRSVWHQVFPGAAA